MLYMREWMIKSPGTSMPSSTTSRFLECYQKQYKTLKSFFCIFLAIRFKSYHLWFHVCIKDDMILRKKLSFWYILCFALYICVMCSKTSFHGNWRITCAVSQWKSSLFEKYVPFSSMWNRHWEGILEVLY